MMWRITQIEEGVIHRSQRPRWISPSEVCIVLHAVEPLHNGPLGDPWGPLGTLGDGGKWLFELVTN